ncbi:asparaginase [Pollutimonas harenae]|uniref:Asparaginase n=1 Tax=Pollutimonas harenae TaxID=657015 RepID=A0A853GZP2_9BURK|nr:asparaginase [Pollutimonas harenae]NYT84889.1 asparaginase [Pollutimonas harenae]TEA72713.1 asparaginase [Pollutimonas harenae]
MTFQPLPTIALLGTGGTIASTASSSTALTNYTVTEGVDALLMAVPALSSLANIQCQQVFNVDSRNITNAMLLKLANKVNRLLTDPDIDGIVITHGTDTLEETAYFLNLVIKSAKPVVLVGAMRPASALSADGPLNLYNAVLLAASPQVHGLGVLLTLNGSVHAASLVSKVHTSHVQAFSSHEQGSLGQITDGKLQLFQRPYRAHTTETVFQLKGIKKLPLVDILYDHQSAGLHLYEAAINAGVQGIVIAGSGNGSLSPKAEKGARLAKQYGVACVRSSRTGSGIVTSSQNDARRGLIAAHALNPQKARILLMLSLAHTSERSTIQSYFEHY